MLVVDDIKLICPMCKGELDLIRGGKLFGVLKCCSCNSLYPLGNYFPGIPDLRPRELRIGLYEMAWFKIFVIESKQQYSKDINRGVNEIPYYIALLKEHYSTKYHSKMEREFLEKFKRVIGEGKVLSIGYGDGRELRLIGRNDLGIDIFPSDIILSNSLGVKALLADTLNLPFEDRVFDGILAIQSLGYVPLKLSHKALLEIHRVLKPSGIALLPLEKTPSKDGVDKEFNYVYEDEYVRVKRHFHRE